MNSPIDQAPDLHAAAVEARMHLVENLKRRGWIRTAGVERAFACVPRHLFVRAFYAFDGEPAAGWRLQYQPRRRNLDDWYRTVYSDISLVTSLDAVSRTPTSSSTAPWLMAAMLEALAVQPRQKVLEVGTGTGYLAALLATLVGAPSQVYTMEVDSRQVLMARQALRVSSVGGVHVVHGDGRLGFPKAAPYERIIATAAARCLPDAWLGQLATGGVVVAPLQGHLSGGIVRLEKLDGSSAVGTFLDLPDVGFTLLHSPGQTGQSSGPTDLARSAIREPPRARHAVADAMRTALLSRDSQFGLFLQFAMPNLQWLWLGEDATPLLVDRQAQAVMRFQEGTDHLEVWIHGDAAVWDSVVAQHELYRSAGEPAAPRFSMTWEAGAGQFVTVTGTDLRWRLVTELACPSWTS